MEKYKIKRLSDGKEFAVSAYDLASGKFSIGRWCMTYSEIAEWAGNSEATKLLDHLAGLFIRMYNDIITLD